MIVFMIIAACGILLLIVVSITESEVDDAFLLPIICGLVNFGVIGSIMFYVSANLILAIVIAGIISGITGFVIYLVRGSLETEAVDFKTLEGEKATVEIPFSHTEIGRVTVMLDGEEQGFPARALDPDDPPYQKGDKVIIKTYDGTIAEIIKSVNWELKKLKKNIN